MDPLDFGQCENECAPATDSTGMLSTRKSVAANTPHLHTVLFTKFHVIATD